MAEIIFYKDATGEQPALKFITQDVPRKAASGEIPFIIPALIAQGLKAIKDAKNYPVGKYENFWFTFSLSEENEEDEDLDAELVKPLAVSPIYEMRVTFRGIWFRAIYFPIIYNEKQHYCFTHAFFKTRNPDYDPTNKFRDEAKDIYQRMRKDSRFAEKILTGR